MIIVTFAVMLACVCMYVCMCVCVSWRLLVNTISQEGKLGQFSYLVCRCTTLSTRSLLFLVEVKGHLGSTGVKLWKPCKNLVNTISQQGKLGQISYLVCRCTTLSTRSHCFCGGQRSLGVNRGHLVNRYLKHGSLLFLCGGQRSLWGQQGSNCENLVNTISQAWKLGQISYLVCRYTTLSKRSLLFFVEVKGH